jgi:hypothetical protein
MDIGEVLLRRGVVNRQQIDLALAQGNGRRLDRALVEMGVLSEEDAVAVAKVMHRSEEIQRSESRKKGLSGSGSRRVLAEGAVPLLRAGWYSRDFSHSLGGIFGRMSWFERLVTRPAFARHMGRRTALEAASAGLEFVDIEMTLPREMATSVRELLAADNLADELCEIHHLLTPRSTPEMVSLRTWMTECIVTQAEQDAEPVPYHEWLQRRG